MKTTYFFIVLFIIISSCSTKKTESISKDDLIEVYINRDWTVEMLEQTKRELALKNITFNYSDLSFYEDGSLKGLTLAVDCHDGYKGVADSQSLSKTLKLGFFRNYSKKAKRQFAIGAFKF